MNKKLIFLFCLFIFPFQAFADDVLNVEMAQQISSKALSYARSKGQKISVAIVNSEGNLIHFQRDNGSYAGSIGASMSKAKSASIFQRPTSAFVEGITQGRTGLVSADGIVAVEGGVPIVINGKHVGAIGVSGAKSLEDEECAKAALVANDTAVEIRK